MRSLLGANLPYFFGSYAHDLATNARFADWPCDFRDAAAYGPLLETRALGLEAVRIWLCEGAEGVEIDKQGRVTGVQRILLDRIKQLEEGALVAGVRIYFTLLDANSALRDNDEITYSIFADADQAKRFAEHVAAPIAKILDPRVTIGLEIANEPETLTTDCPDEPNTSKSPPLSWEAMGRTIAFARGAAMAERADLLVTAGTTHVFLPKLWQSGAELSAVDIHFYHAGGGLPSRQDLATYVGDPRILELPLIAGECGIPKVPGPDEPFSLLNFIFSADRNDYQAAFLWKLEGDLINSSYKPRPPTELGLALRDALGKRPIDGFTR
ncbi:MAG: hypothetical protein IPK60_01290 [Sandaracinaceae bacterium]|nr:hypothetical protein [Sandaracinaceae bacterium]